MPSFRPTERPTPSRCASNFWPGTRTTRRGRGIGRRSPTVMRLLEQNGQEEHALLQALTLETRDETAARNHDREPNRPICRDRLALVLAHRGDLQQARQQWQEAAAIYQQLIDRRTRRRDDAEQRLGYLAKLQAVFEQLQPMARRDPRRTAIAQASHRRPGCPTIRSCGASSRRWEACTCGRATPKKPARCWPTRWPIGTVGFRPPPANLLKRSLS